VSERSAVYRAHVAAIILPDRSSKFPTQSSPLRATVVAAYLFGADRPTICSAHITANRISDSCSKFQAQLSALRATVLAAFLIEAE
jgi:hypothetical protein